MSIVLRLLAVSVVTWLVPFIISLPFFDQSGQLVINFWVFKLLMLAILVAVSFFLFRWFYSSQDLSHRGWIFFGLIGCVAVAINIALDAATIIQLTRMSTTQYLTQIASVYLSIIGISIFTGTRNV